MSILLVLAGWQLWISSLLFFILDQLIVIYSIIHHDVSAETTSCVHIDKLENLLAKKRGRMESKGLSLRPQGLKKWVVNLMNKTLTKDQESVLELGLNFAPAPTKLPMLDTIAGVELGACRLGMDEASDLLWGAQEGKTSS